MSLLPAAGEAGKWQPTKQRSTRPGLSCSVLRLAWPSAAPSHRACTPISHRFADIAPLHPCLDVLFCLFAFLPHAFLPSPQVVLGPQDGAELLRRCPSLLLISFKQLQQRHAALMRLATPATSLALTRVQ